MFNDTYVVSGQQLMPFKPNIRKETEKVANVLGNLIFPALLSVNMPAFLYSIVLEKEQRLIQNMKINGLAMKNYWIVNYWFNYAQYIISAMCFYLFGRYVALFSFFTDSVTEVILLTFFGWGLNQVSLSFFISSFLTNSQNASMLGYVISIVGSIITSTLLLTKSVYLGNKDQLLPFLYHVPQFPFGRIIMHFANKCAWDSCQTNLEDVEEEIFRCLFYVYLNPIIYLVLALYLNEVIP